MKKLLFLSVVLAMAVPCAGEIIYVDAVDGNDLNDGLSWETAFATIQKGIDASDNGNEIWVAEGTYNENIAFGGKNVTVTSTVPNDPNVVADTIINGSGADAVVTFQGTESASCLLAGFTITNGDSTNGGGVCGNNNQATIKNNVITGNLAQYGGGLNACNGIIKENVIIGNAAKYGGGLSNSDGTIQDNTISENYNVNYDGTPVYFGHGAGLFLCNGSILDNTITDNEADSLGGGLYHCGGNIKGNTITGNDASTGGGGLDSCDGTIENNTISSNSAWFGAGLSACDGTIQNNNISDNLASYRGGGLSSCWGTIQNNIIKNNTVVGTSHDGYGGGLDGCSNGIIENNIIIGNSARHGGGLYECGEVLYPDCDPDPCCGPLYIDATIQNNLIVANSADDDGGGMGWCRGFMQNNTIYGNSASLDGGGMYYCGGSITNCIIWANTVAGSSNQIKGCPDPGDYCATPSYSCIQDWPGGGTGNIDANPNFTDPANGDYHLLYNSPCIDVGDNSAVYEATDLDGRPRIMDGDGNGTAVVDMGAYEFQGIIHVDADATGAEDGSSWADAYTSLPYALDVALCGDEIWVAQGTYRPNDGIVSIPEVDDRELTFQLKSGVSVKGGYAGYGEPDPDARNIDAYETILSGDLLGNDVGDPEWPEDPSRDDNSYHVVTGSGTGATAVLDGFTVTAGNAPYAGGGMYNDMGSPTVTNCVFSANSAYYYGCGMDNSSSSPTVTNCSFTGNSGGGAGGGMSNTNSSPTVTNCTFSGNSAPGIFISEGGGGGIYNRESSPTLTNCIFSGNSAGRGGGGISNYYDSSPTLTNCTFNGNSAPVGGGMENAHGSSPVLTNCLFIGNSADDDGGAILCGENSGSTLIINSTITANSAGFKGGGIFCGSNSNLTITNGILWDNTADFGQQIYNFGGSLTITYCDVQGGWEGMGNINAAPLFVDPNGPDGIVGTEDDDLRLSPGSPCINAGDNSVVDPNDTDLDGNPRIVSSVVDMGAYEFQGIIYVDDDAPNDPGPGDPNVSDPSENGTETHPFDEIQEGIDMAHDGDTVIVNEGLYLGQLPWEPEEINFLGKNITLTSTDPADPNKTVIRGTVQFSGTENSDCTLTGFRIHDLAYGAIYGNHTQATISHCILSGNGPCGATVIENCDGTISNCLITDNTTIFRCGVYPVVFGCHGTIKNCTIANNASGISVLDGAEATIENCIIYYNDESFTPQVSVGSAGTLNISYCDVQGGLAGISGAGTVNPGPGNIDADPCFVQLGYWQEDPCELVEGDYHLKSEGWRWRGFLFHDSWWTYDYVTSRCIDAANPGSPLLDEVMTVLPDDPENEWGENIRRNMGVYGGTAQASMPPHGWALLADLTNDGIVNLADFAGQSLDWLATEAEQPGDLNRDGIVDITDAAMVATDWLEVTTWAQ